MSYKNDPYILTYTGKKFHFLDPDVSEEEMELFKRNNNIKSLSPREAKTFFLSRHDELLNLNK